jgi:hypothetical protein
MQDLLVFNIVTVVKYTKIVVSIVKNIKINYFAMYLNLFII